MTLEGIYGLAPGCTVTLGRHTVHEWGVHVQKKGTKKLIMSDFRKCENEGVTGFVWNRTKGSYVSHA